MLAIYIIVFFVLIIIGAPIAISMGVSCGLWLIFDPNLPNIIIAQKLVASVENFTLMAIPFFMLAGQLMEKTGITEKIVNFANSLVGHIRGGIAHTTVVTGVIMAGISGSANADASAIGALMLPTLRKSGYEDGFAVCVVAAAAALGPIIPPSIIMIIYGSVTGFPIGKLFLSGILPGLLLAFGFIVICYIYAVINKLPRSKFAGFRNIFKSFLSTIWALFMPFIIIGGILTGVFTATEAGVIAVVYGLIYGVITRRLTFKIIVESLGNAVAASAVPMLIIAMSTVFGNMLVRENVVSIISNFCSTYISTYFEFYMFVIVVCLILGCFLDAGAGMLILIPVLLPVVKVMGLDSLHFACVFIIALLTAGLTPPVGVLLFVVCGIGNIPVKKCLVPVIPFVAVMVVGLILMVIFPGITTFIPSLVK